jgi:hypothetical protein
MFVLIAMCMLMPFSCDVSAALKLLLLNVTVDTQQPSIADTVARCYLLLLTVTYRHIRSSPPLPIQSPGALLVLKDLKRKGKVDK